MNYYTDNDDLRFLFERTDLDYIIRLYEDDFRQHKLYDYAPESVEDARENYERTLTVCGDIAARIIAPRAGRIDTEPNTIEGGRVVYSPALQECLQALWQADLMACTVSRRYGGLYLPNFVFTMLVEIIARADASLQNMFGLQGVSAIIEEFAAEELKQQFLPRFADGRVTGAMALTEEDAGSDLQNVRLKAEEEPDGSWRLSGVKRFITNGSAEIILVLARSEAGTTDGLGLSMFVCERDESVRVRRLEEKLGIHGSPTCEVVFDNTRAWLIGERQRGLVTYTLALLNGARLATAAQSVGIAQAAFDEARAYAHVRRQYGRRIEALPPVTDMLIGMKIELEASRALMYETAKIMDLSVATTRRMSAQGVDPAEKKSLRKEAKRFERLTMLLTSIAKYYCSEMCSRVASDAMQVLGGSGYMQDYPVERNYRDARITSIYEGTSQMQIVSAYRGIISGTLDKFLEELASREVPRQQATLATRLERGRRVLAGAVAYLEKQRDNQLMELAGRQLVDMGAALLIGYLLMHQSLHNSRKLKVARRFISDMEPRLKMNAGLIERIDPAALKDYEAIVGPVFHA